MTFQIHVLSIIRIFSKSGEVGEKNQQHLQQLQCCYSKIDWSIIFSLSGFTVCFIYIAIYVPHVTIWTIYCSVNEDI